MRASHKRQLAACAGPPGRGIVAGRPRAGGAPGRKQRPHQGEL